MSRRNVVNLNAEPYRKIVNYGLESIEVEMPGLDRANGTNPASSMEYRCQKCGHGLDLQTVDGDRIYSSLQSGDVDCLRGGYHDSMHLPLSWANSVGMEFNEKEDSIKVTVSVGDPRGAFVMQLRRVVDDGGNETLLMHVPHPDDSTPHAELTEHHPGTYLIG